MTREDKQTIKEAILEALREWSKEWRSAPLTNTDAVSKTTIAEPEWDRNNPLF